MEIAVTKKLKLVLILLMNLRSSISEELLFPYGATVGDTSVLPGDDEVLSTNLTIPFSFYGTEYTDVFFTDNGIITFEPFADAIADEDFPGAFPALIAPYFDDHASNGNMLFYRQSMASTDLKRATRYLKMLFRKKSYVVVSVFIVTWDSFPGAFDAAFDTPNPLLNTCQAALVTTTTDSLVLFLYDHIQHALFPTIGVNAGNGIHYQQICSSQTPLAQDIDVMNQFRCGRKGLLGFIVEIALFYCKENINNRTLIDVNFVLTLTGINEIQALDTENFRNGIYSETGLPNCEEMYTGNQCVLTFTVDPTDKLDPGCGTFIEDDTVYTTVEAHKETNIHSGGDVIFQFSCHANDVLPVSIDTVVSFEGTPEIKVKRGPRTLQLDVRDVGTGSVPTGVVDLGDYLYLQLTYDPGLESGVSDPLGVRPVDCWFGDGAGRTKQMLSNGCITEPEKRKRNILLRSDFVRSSPPSSPLFVTSSGSFQAAKFINSETVIYTCIVEFCSGLQLEQCKNSCDTSRRKRSIFAPNGVSDVHMTTVTTYVTFRDEIYANDNKTVPTKRCVEPSVVYSVLSTLILLLIVGVIIDCILVKRIINKKQIMR